MTWVKLGFLLAVLVGGGLFVARRWDSLIEAMAGLSWVAAVASLLMGVVGLCFSMMAWREMLADLGSPLPIRAAGRVFFIAQLGKYLPGSVWSVLAQIELSHELKVPRRTSFTVSVLVLLMSMTVGLTVAAVLLPFGGAEVSRRYWWVVLIIPVMVAMLHPAVSAAAVNTLLRLLRRAPLQQRTTGRGNLKAAGWTVLTWLALGLHAWLLVIGMGGSVWRSLPVTVGGFALAFCLGVLFIPAPAGAGVRDVALGLVLGGVLGGGEAAAVVLISRVGLALADFVLAGAWSGAQPGRGVARLPPPVRSTD